MGENTYNQRRNKFWKDHSLPIAKGILGKLQELCHELEEADGCTDDLYCWFHDLQIEFSNIPEL